MLEDLQALVAVVEARSLTKAATTLHVTQSAVSRRLQHLEAVLGASLLDRAQRPPAPTPLGVRVYQQAVPIVRAFEDLMAMAKETSDPIGVIRLGVAQGIGDLVLADAVERLQDDFPKLDLRLRTDWSRGLSQQVADGVLDAALVMLQAASRPSPGLHGRCLASVRTVIVQQKSGSRFNNSVRLAHLAKEPWVLNPLGCGYRAAIEAAMGQRDGDLRVAIDAYGADVQLRMVAAGHGLGLVPAGALKASPVKDKIAVVHVSDFSLVLDAWLINRRQVGNLRKALDALADVVSARLNASL